MILHSKPLSEFVLIRANWWLIHSQWSEPREPPIHPSLPRIHRSSVVHLTNVQLLCVLCDLCGLKPFLQNKANVKMGNINISTPRTKAYANKQRTMNNKRYSKQSQSNPILSRRSPERSRIPTPPSCAGKESRISERNAYPYLSGQHQRSRIQYRESSIEYRVSRIQLHCAKQSQCQNG